MYQRSIKESCSSVREQDMLKNSKPLSPTKWVQRLAALLTMAGVAIALI